MTKPPKTQTGKLAIRALWEDAQDEMDEQKPVTDPEPSLARTFDGYGAIKPGQWEGAPWGALPPECPVQVLGMKGEVVYIVSATGNLHAVEKWDLPTIAKLFTPHLNYALWAWPAFGDGGKDQDGNPLPPKVKRLERDKCMMALVGEAGRRGMFDPQDQLRGRGGWKTPEGRYLWHSGNGLWVVDYQIDGKGQPKNMDLKRAKPGAQGDHFYAKDSAILKPWRSPVEVNDSPAHSILSDLKSWNWSRAWLDPVLVLGWIVSAFMGAALDERPIIFVIGGQGTGKSHLNAYIRAIFGRALLATANTTAAGIYQNLKQDSRPVMVDEFEAQARGDKERVVIELARQAFSGAELYRGGQNHDGVEFTLRSSFAFTAIIPPPLTVQDKSRMAIMTLQPLKAQGEEPVLPAEAGRQMLRQIMDGFYGFEHVILQKWRKILNRAAFNKRQIDTYGTLLAAAELVVGEGGLIAAGFPAIKGKIDEDFLVEMLQHATKSELADQEEKWETVVDKILSAPIENWKSGEKPTVGQTLAAYERGRKNGAEGIELWEARHRLENAGLTLFEAGKKMAGYTLAVPVSHDALAKIFRETEFRDGGWSHALKQAPELIVARAATAAKIGKVAKQCYFVDIEAYDARKGDEG